MEIHSTVDCFMRMARWPYQKKKDIKKGKKVLSYSKTHPLPLFSLHDTRQTFIPTKRNTSPLKSQEANHFNFAPPNIKYTSSPEHPYSQ